MDEYSRIVIEEYCRTHRRTKKSAFLWDLVELSYTMECEPEDWEGIQLERYIAREKNRKRIVLGYISKKEAVSGFGL